MKHTPRRLLALLSLALLLTVGAQAANDTALLPRAQSYAGQFADVRETDWFYPYVSASYEYALINGRDNGFEPDADVSVAELLTLSARIHAAYAGEPAPTVAAEGAWYLPFVRYLADRGLLDPAITDYDVPATRAQLAGIFAATLPEDCFDSGNAALVTDAYASGRYIADVDEYTPWQPQILWLYRQGLLSGVDDKGSFWPDKTTSRAEAAAVVTRMADPSLRLTLDWGAAPPQSAAGTTFADLVSAPDDVSLSPAYSDSSALDALVRHMLASGADTMSLSYPYTLSQADAQTLANVFTDHVKRYCEQMYNSVVVTRYVNSGHAALRFSATACSSEQLAQYRAETLAKAIEVHDLLWETGALTADMSQYEIARVYFLWLCDHCAYDWDNASDSRSLSHIAYSALLRGEAVCDGYTGAYNLLLKLEGIDCYALHNNEHIWTVATLDGATYHIDVTWGDQNGRSDLRFFGMTEEQSYSEHPW